MGIKTPLFLTFTHVNWPRVWLCSFAAGGAWGALAAIIPGKVHIFITSILGAFTIGLGILIRGSKYIEERKEIPPPGVQP